MTLSLQLGIWLTIAFFGWLAMLPISYRTYARLQIFHVIAPDDDALLEGTWNQMVYEGLGLAAWSIWLGIGLAALFDTNQSGPVGQTLIGQLIVVGLISALGVSAAATIFSFIVGLRQERRAKAMIASRRSTESQG